MYCTALLRTAQHSTIYRKNHVHFIVLYGRICSAICGLPLVYQKASGARRATLAHSVEQLIRNTVVKVCVGDKKLNKMLPWLNGRAADS